MRLRKYLSGDLQTMLIANSFESGMRFGAFVVYSAVLGADLLGVVTTITALVQLATSLTQVGIDSSVISLGSKHYGAGEQERLLRLCHSGAWLHVVLGLIVSVPGLLLAAPLARIYLEDPGQVAALTLAFVGIFVTRLAAYVLSVLRTYQKFRHYAVAGLASAFVLLTGVAWLFATDGIDVLGIVVLTLLVAPAVKLVVGALGVPAAIFRPQLPSRERVREILSFGKWIWGTSLLDSGVRRVNILLLTSLAGFQATGYFQMASRLAEFLSLIFEPVRKYLLPKFTAIADRPAMRRALSKTYSRLGWTVLILPPAWILAAPAMRIFPGAEWMPAVFLFQVLIAARLLFLLSKPLAFVLFSLKRPEVQTYLHLLGMVIYMASAAFLIPQYGAAGAAWSIFVFSATLLVAFAVYVTRALRRPQGGGGEAA
ncbi:MAG: oligosaccharide flippase family protein [bacterium]|nr:oligosaccharide flippase family protein [bacterium]